MSGNEMTTLDLGSLPDPIRGLIESAELCPLGPGRENAAVCDQLQQIQPESISDEPVVDDEMASCCISALWLLHNYLDRSHTISQDIPTGEGSYWHGIMHRREPDFPNAKYWFRRVGQHAVFDSLPAAARAICDSLAVEDPSLRQLADGPWDPMLFIDCCENAYRGDPGSAAAEACRRMADAEWKLRFQFCLTRASR